ncbi:hypothetical protein BHE74_00037511 [Ensete ventricosum]|nr:hypothetical protein BHE74_00037511 [Ensete ventricosum]
MIHQFKSSLDLQYCDIESWQRIGFHVVGELPRRARRNEEHDQARVRCPLEKVRISFLPFQTPIPSGVCQGLHFFASIGLQEQHWVLTRGFHVPRSHKVKIKNYSLTFEGLFCYVHGLVRSLFPHKHAALVLSSEIPYLILPISPCFESSSNVSRAAILTSKSILFVSNFPELSGTQEEAAEAYDIAAIKFRGVNAVTNFDITRYDVDKIMASSTLLSGELARRTKVNDSGKEPILEQSSCKDLLEENSSSGSGWKMDFQPAQQAPPLSESHDPKSLGGGGDYRSPMEFSPVLHGLVVESLSPAQGVGDLEKTGNCHAANPASTMTTVGCSPEEGHLDGTGFSLMYAKASAKFTSSTTISSWVPPAQLRPTISMSQMPVFAAWGDA